MKRQQEHKQPTTRWIYLAVCVALLIMGLFSCRYEVPEPPLGQREIRFSRVVDLTQVITQDMPTRPGALHPALNGPSPDGTHDLLALSTRVGSRIRAAGDGRAGSVEHLSAADLVAPAVVIDLRDEVADSGDYRISADAIRAWEGKGGVIAPGSIVLLATGWDLRWSTPGAYLNLDEQQRIRAPAIDATALALLHERGVRGVGIDSPHLLVDGLVPPREANWIVLEDLTSLEQLPPRGATLVIGALRLQGSTGSPIRVFAFVP